MASVFQRIDWPLTLLMGAFVYAATPYVLDWSRTIYEIVFTAEGREQFNLLQVISEGSLSRRLALFALAGLGLDGLIRRRLPLSPHFALGNLLLLYLAWSTASLLWAQDVDLTLRRIIILWCLAFGALGLSARLDFTRLVTATLAISGATLALSLGAELVAGTFHPLNADYRFTGLMHPVMQGWNCSLLFLSALSLVRTGHTPRWLLWLLVAAGLAGILLTRSRWPLASSLVGALAILQLTGSMRTVAVLGLWGGVVACVGLLAMADDPITRLQQMAALGRGEEAVQELGSFTGRTKLWSALLDLWADHPILGYGYNTFQTPAVITRLRVLMDWEPSNSHSGYIQLLLGLGIVGLVLFLAILVVALQRAVALVRQERLYVFAVAVLLWLVINLVLETVVITDPLLPTLVVFMLLTHLALFAPTTRQDSGRP